MFKPILAPLAVAVALLSSVSAAEAQSPTYLELRAVEAPTEAAALNAAANDLCSRKLVLLGENGFHGDGRTAAFKAALVERLVTTCGFNTVLFEASRYDFIALSRALRNSDPASAEMLSSAIGGLWNQNEEMQGLIPFLFDRASTGQITLGGLDDQLGSRGTFYSLEQMPTELASILPTGRREDCGARLKQRIWSRFSSTQPYNDKAKQDIRQCLNEIDTALTSAAFDRAQDRADLQAMVTGFNKVMDRDAVNGPDYVWARDRDMFANLQATMATLPSDARVIVWSANGHVAKDARATPLYAEHDNLGAYIHRAYGDQAFALGFTAASGAYRYTVRTPRDIPPAQPGSLEALALPDPGIEAAYLTSAQLAKLPATKGSAFDDHQPVTANWGQVYDGIVVFKTERPPRRIDE